MTSLTGRTPAASYKDLLQVSNANAGIDGTLRPVEDGEGTQSALQLSQTAARLAGPLDFAGTTHAGVTLNSLTTAQRDALTPVAGMLVHNATTGRMEEYSGTAWVSAAAPSLTNYARLDTPQSYTRQQNTAQAALADGAAVAWDLNLAQAAALTLGGNRALAAPANMAAGGTYLLVVRQDATGGRTLSYDASYKWPGGSAPVLSTAANAVDLLAFVSDGTSMFGSITKDFR